MSANITKLVVMLEMQHAMNTKVHQQWFEQGFEWYRAIWVECAEMLIITVGNGGKSKRQILNK